MLVIWHTIFWYWFLLFYLLLLQNSQKLLVVKYYLPSGCVKDERQGNFVDGSTVPETNRWNLATPQKVDTHHKWAPQLVRAYQVRLMFLIQLYNNTLSTYHSSAWYEEQTSKTALQ